VANALYRILQRTRQRRRALAIALEQVERDALRRLATDTRHAAQGIDHPDQKR
jgi:hypothetical protein